MLQFLLSDSKFSNFQLPAYPIIIYYASREFLILFEPYYFKQTDR